MQNQKNISELETSLRAIHLADFENIKDPALLEWAQPQEEMPENFRATFNNLPKETNLFDVLLAINDKLTPLDGTGDKGKSFADSRFTKLSEMLERHMVSCGAVAKIYSEILRRLHIPTQLVHAVPNDASAKSEHRHAWIKIYDPKTEYWLALDPSRSHERFAVDDQKYREIKIYRSWAELKPDFECGDY